MIVGMLLFFGRQIDIANVGINDIDSLVGMLEQDRDISKPELMALLKSYAKEAKSGREMVVSVAEFMRYAGLFLSALAIVQITLLFKAIWRFRNARSPQ
ncbi:MAG: hypothetical protein A3I66_02305 [Burkholderiales bacterium RIFCSPLOWO2_02_FULL_57_36]|nr:MAG: hypothetical protein A3I66_02305 [Burkholderiales bacterium RIFCSPLOWO2_02_FULL_57_36]